MFLIHTPPEHAETVARGAACNTDLLLVVDFFQHASEPLESPFGAMKLPSDK